jgi:hypothetical protein
MTGIHREYRPDMGNFVMGLLLVQLILGGYQFSIVSGAGRPESVARATRLPTPVIFGHATFAVLAVVIWIAYLGTHSRTVAWIAFAVLACGASLGIVMLLRTVGRPLRLPVSAGSYPEDADVTVAEELIPRPAMVLHGLAATGLLLCTFLVAIGVGR